MCQGRLPAAVLIDYKITYQIRRDRKFNVISIPAKFQQVICVEVGKSTEQSTILVFPSLIHKKLALPPSHLHLNIGQPFLKCMGNPVGVLGKVLSRHYDQETSLTREQNTPTSVTP